MNIEEYGKKHIHFYIDDVPKMLTPYLKDKQKVLDLGCGDGNLLLSLRRRYPNSQLTGIDLSKARCEKLRSSKNNIRVICSDVTDIKSLKSNTFDIIISNQVIEHVTDDNKAVEEAYRLLKKKGVFYVSSVIKKKYGVYIYRVNGKFVLDPTHVREYKSKQSFLSLLINFRILGSKTSTIRYPLINLMLRLLKVKDSLFFVKYPVLTKLRVLRIIVPGWNLVEAVCQKNH